MSHSIVQKLVFVAIFAGAVIAIIRPDHPIVPSEANAQAAVDTHSMLLISPQGAPMDADAQGDAGITRVVAATPLAGQ